jgi:glucosamine--fructose-6-phosphate aminotransferase (isomerizing)
MCGIFACVGSSAAAEQVLQGLRDLEYRGYDSAGIAAQTTDGLTVVRREGKIGRLADALSESPIAGTCAVGHTRWATHGRPSDDNSHPHRSCDGAIAVVHNGIVENHAALKTELIAAGHAFTSETDTEVIAHLLEDRVAAGDDLFRALRSVAPRLEGSQAIAAISGHEPDTVVATRIGNAGGVVLGQGDGRHYIASDLPALLPHTRRVAFLHDGEFARITATKATRAAGLEAPTPCTFETIAIDPTAALKGTYPTFMLKEIHEQPEALADTIQSLVSLDPVEFRMPDLGIAADRLPVIRRVVLVGMGTSLNAAMVGRQYFERLAGIPAEADNASEFRHRAPVLGPETLVVSISQSGETVDVLEAMNVAKDAGALQITICNNEGGQTTRVAEGTVYTRAGLERGVASTKSYVAAIAALHVLALHLGRLHGRIDASALDGHLADLVHLPGMVGRVLSEQQGVAGAAALLSGIENAFFLGRGLAFPVAMEGALKLKEISYLHAEGYAAGEMKHGPIALIEPAFATVAIAPKHALRTKMLSNIQQVQARGGRVIAVVTEGDDELTAAADAVMPIPDAGPWLEPIVATIPLQLLAYEVASARGFDIDQPRNLAKTVTVE